MSGETPGGGGAEPRSLVPLSELIDRLAGDGPRDERFVRRFCAWFHQRAPYLRVEALEALGLVDVALTFRMKGQVTLVATGRRPDFPGEITVRFSEQELPFVAVAVERDPRPEPYTICTLDYSVAGRPVALAEERLVSGRNLPAGTPGHAVVETTVGPARHVRVVLAPFPNAPVNLPPEGLRWLDLI